MTFYKGLFKVSPPDHKDVFMAGYMPAFFSLVRAGKSQVIIVQQVCNICY